MNQLEKEFVPYELALELKELGFDEPCNTCYDKLKMVASYGKNVFDCKNYNTSGYTVSRPTFSQAFRWFREKYDLQCHPESTGSNRYACRYDGNDEKGYRWVGYLRESDNKILFYKTYEEAEIACLMKLIEIVKNKK